MPCLRLLSDFKDSSSYFRYPGFRFSGTPFFFVSRFAFQLPGGLFYGMLKLREKNMKAKN